MTNRLNPQLVTGIKARLVRKRIHVRIFLEAFRFFGNPVLALRELRRLRTLRSQVHGAARITKYVRSGNRYFWNTDYGGFPSAVMKEMIRDESERNVNSSNDAKPYLQTLIWGITNRCPLSCSHCYEWDNIENNERLDTGQLFRILQMLKENGVRHIQFSGGEPLVRFDDLLVLVREASAFADCWLLTSGFGLTREKASALVEAGLTGAQISLDHWDEKLHNTFRNNNKSYGMVREAVRNCRESGIIVSLSLCATRSFVTPENLMKYADTARNMGAHFIRILEPRAVGRFSHSDVSLTDEQVSILSDFAIRMNNQPGFRDYPIVAYFGYHQRLLGCFGAGNRYLYIDPNGDVHACPFCRGKKGNILEEPFEEIISKVRRAGCHEFRTLSFTGKTKEKAGIRDSAS